MNLNDILGAVEIRKNPKRRGRGEGSGLGKSAGRGNKGAKARSGWRTRYGYEGGQMPIVRRVPKRGFNNYNFASWFDCVNVGDLNDIFSDGDVVDRKILIEKGALKARCDLLKILGTGDLKKKLTVTAHSTSAGAKKKIEAAGGTITCLIPPRKIHKRFVARVPVAPAKDDAAKKPAEGKVKKEKGPEKGPEKQGGGGKSPAGAAGEPKKKDKKPEAPPAKGGERKAEKK